MKKLAMTATALSALVFLAGCVTTPDGPTVPVMPGKGKSQADFARDDADCEQYAEARVKNKADDANNRAVVDTLVGAGLGAAVGSAFGHGNGAGPGAAIGGALGASVGANDSAYAQNTIQGRYNMAYAQCMSTHGDQVADGPRRRPWRRRYYDDMPPPPPPPPGY
ncbi:MAG TPA: YMGG-like glycine zipper-containing protein [Rhizomicrobium sp.]|jgi:hypothetical protein